MLSKHRMLTKAAAELIKIVERWRALFSSDSIDQLERQKLIREWNKSVEEFHPIVKPLSSDESLAFFLYATPALLQGSLFDDANHAAEAALPLVKATLKDLSLFIEDEMVDARSIPRAATVEKIINLMITQIKKGGKEPYHLEKQKIADKAKVNEKTVYRCFSNGSLGFRDYKTYRRECTVNSKGVLKKLEAMQDKGSNKELNNTDIDKMTKDKPNKGRVIRKKPA